MSKIIITGGAGYIGSHTIVDLLNCGHQVISVDNLSRSSGASFDGIEAITGVKVKNYNIDLKNSEATAEFFNAEDNIDAIIHFAAYKFVDESVDVPLLYYDNNLNSLINILQGAEKAGIKNFIFSSSCSVYGNVHHLPVTESTPVSTPASPYAASKQMGEQIVKDVARLGTMKAILLRYFNPVGAHPSAFIGENPLGKPNNLVPVITQTGIGRSPAMKVWGNDYPTRDGSCVRDYIHVMDIARAHTLSLDYLSLNKNEASCEVFNVGSGNGVTVLEAIQAFERISGKSLNYSIGPRRKGDVEAIYANNELICKKLGWHAQYNLDEMLQSAWRWELRQQEHKMKAREE